jgi:hypothetical protein
VDGLKIVQTPEEIEFITRLHDSCEEAIKVVENPETLIVVDDMSQSFLDGYKDNLPTVFICKPISEEAKPEDVEEIFAVSFKSKRALNELIKLLQNQRKEFK